MSKLKLLLSCKIHVEESHRRKKFHNVYVYRYLTGNPCTDYRGYREYVITVLPQLKKLDGTEIMRSERIQALQIFEYVKVTILKNQIEYTKKRELQKQAVAIKSENHLKITELDDEDDKAFWSQPSENTPEARIEIANHTRKAKELKERKDDVKPKRVIQLFNKEGKPRNINEAKINFIFEEDDENNCYKLELHIYRYLDTSLLDVDVQPTYVKVLIKGKVFQLTLDEEVKIEESTAKRSQTTGYLVVTMPKVGGCIKLKKSPLPVPSFLDNEDTQSDKFGNITRREVLEIGSGRRQVDYTKICENNRMNKEESTVKSPFRRSDIQEKKPSKDFVDDLEVPPLE